MQDHELSLIGMPEVLVGRPSGWNPPDGWRSSCRTCLQRSWENLGPVGSINLSSTITARFRPSREGRLLPSRAVDGASGSPVSGVASVEPWHHRVFRNTLVNGAATLIAVVVGFVLTPFLIRHLGASGYGLWALVGAFSVSAGYLSLADLGFGQTIVKLVAEHEARGEWQEVGDVVRAGLAFFVVMGLVLGAAMALFTVFLLDDAFNIPIRLHDDVHRAFLLFSIQIPIEFSALPLAGVLQGRQRYPVFRAIELLRTLIWIVVVVVALPRGGGLTALAASTLGAAAIGLVVTAFAAVRALPAGTIVWGRSLRPTLRRMFTFSRNLFVTQLTGVLYRQMDRIIIAAALTSVLLARYEIAAKIQLLAALCLSITVSAIMPAASGLSAMADGRERLRALFLDGTKYSCALVLPVTIALMIWADDLVKTWVGSDFASSVGYARWFLAWVIPTTATSLGLTIVVGMGFVREVMYLGLASALINLGLSVALVGPLGVLGVIVGTLIGYTIVWFPYMSLFLRVLDVRWEEFVRRTALPIIIVCLPWTAAIFLVHMGWHATTLPAVIAAVAVSIASGWVAIFFLALRSGERTVLLASARAFVG
jgi:O-antigen/teichoic acid export membrane protein